MTTCLYDRRTKTIVADTQNTDASGYIYRTNKIERLKNGSYFLGSGHCFTIGQCRIWAENDFAETSRPDFGVFLSDTDEYGFCCLVISPDGKEVTLVDNEMQPSTVKDKYISVGSGASYAIGAMDAGADPIQAVKIACKRDGSTSEPIDVVEIE
jgi:hypothetical protein